MYAFDLESEVHSYQTQIKTSSLKCNSFSHHFLLSLKVITQTSLHAVSHWTSAVAGRRFHRIDGLFLLPSSRRQSKSPLCMHWPDSVQTYPVGQQCSMSLQHTAGENGQQPQVEGDVLQQV